MILFEILINYYEGFLFHFFILSGLKSDKKLLIPFIISALLQGTFYTLSWLYKWSIVDTWICIFPILFSLLFSSSILEKAVWDGILIAVMAGSSGIIYFLSEKVFHVSIAELQQENVIRFIAVFAYNLLMTVIYYLIVRQKRGKVEDVTFLGIILAINLLVICIIDCSFIAVGKGQVGSRWVLLVAILSFAISIFSILLIQIIRKHERREFELKEKELRYEAEQDRIHEMKNIYESVNKTKHDIKEQINVAQQLYNIGAIVQGNQILNALESNLPAIHYCGKTVIDVELSIKENQLRRRCILYDFQICNIEDIQINEVELCSVIANMINNAIEALENDCDLEQKITFIIARSKGMLLIKCCNPVKKEKVIRVKNHLISSKRASGHGLGTEIIQDFANKNNGVCTFEVVQNEFIASVIVPVKI